MSIYFYNTLAHRKEEFRPIEPGVVKMYTCGPTVYNYAHIGNYRAFIFEDLLRRYLKFKGLRVIQVMNITDVDDKIIRDANRDQVPIGTFTAPYEQAFFADLAALGIEPVEHYPRATAHIPEMVALVQTLLAKNYAYKTDDGSVYFKVASFARYGQLANLKVAEMQRGERVANDQYEKEELRDFALWKSWKAEDGPVYWDTELGRGRPGWHIECSAMSMKYLGRHFDLHTGGVDNIFPHHENEIAQSEAATGEKFVNFWLHCEHLLVDDEKMSKSLGNYIYLRDLLGRNLDPAAIRYTLLSTHYRQKLNFTLAKVAASAKAITRLRDFRKSLQAIPPDGAYQIEELITKHFMAFTSALDDDLNISGALGALFSLMHDVNNFREQKPLSGRDQRELLAVLTKFDSVLNVLTGREETLTAAEQALLDARTSARREKNWAEADRLRQELLQRGIILEDTPQGTVWKRK